MIDHLYSSTIFALIAVAAAFCLRRRSAASRHAVLLVAVARFAVPTPLLTRVGTMLARKAPAAPAALADFSRMLPAGRMPSTAIDAAAPLPVFPCLWMAGTAALLWAWLRAVRRRVEPVRAPDALETAALARAMRRIGFAAAIDLRIVSPSEAPGVRGIRRPVVMLPDGLAAALAPEELEAVIAHELVHVRRRDNLSAALARLVVSVFWFHPLLWWIERRILAEREPACDEQVLAHGARPSDYASAILKVCRMAFAGSGAYAGAAGSNLKRRMEQIMSPAVMLSTRKIPRAAWGALIAFAVLAPVIAGFLRAQAPPASRERDAVEIRFAGANPMQQKLSALAYRYVPKPDPKLGPYGKWLAEDVAYIITDQERAAFLRLQSNEEREHFIEQFWQRRDPTPATPKNEAKEEYYRRIAFANQHFAGGNTSGWLTARGRYYIVLGPPDEIDNHSSASGSQTWTYHRFDHTEHDLQLVFELSQAR